MIFKFGISYNEYRREKEHKATIGNYTCFYIIKCDKNVQLEKDYLDIRYLKFGGKKYTELFTTSKNFTIDSMKKYIENWVSCHRSNDEIELAREKTKQEIERTKQLEYEYKILQLKNQKK